MKPHEFPGDAEAELELALDAELGRTEERARAEAELGRRAGGRSAGETLAAQLSRARELLLARARWSEGRERRWRVALLARTTRRDLSWRGDLRLLADFLRQRLRASPALRVVAASLALHVVAAPVVAYWVLREPAPAKRLTLRVEPPSDAPFGADPPPPPTSEDELLRLARRAEARENERARERFVLAQAAASAPALLAATEDPLELRLLAQRAQGLQAAPRSAPRAAGPEWSTLSTLGLALWVELELDQLVRGGQAAPELGPACARAAELSRDGALPPGAREVLRHATARATRLGVLDAVPEAGPSLLAPAWFDALERAGRELDLETHPAWRGWLAWRGKHSP